MRKRICIIHNPASGAPGRRRLERVVALLREAGAEVDEIRTGRHGQGRRRAREAAREGRHDLVVAAGGDGLTHDVAAGLVGADCPMGVLPLGTGNVFARGIGLDFAPAALARTLLRGPVRRIRPGLAGGEPFLFVAGVGFDAAAARVFEASGCRRLGRAGYVWPVLRALAAEKDAPLTVTADGARRKAAWIIVTRATHYAAGIPLAPAADFFSGELHAVLFSGAGAIPRIRDLAILLSGRAPSAGGVVRLSGREILIEGPPETPVQIDGEPKGRLPLALGVHPRRLPVVFPFRGRK